MDYVKQVKYPHLAAIDGEKGRWSTKQEHIWSIFREDNVKLEGQALADVETALRRVCKDYGLSLRDVRHQSKATIRAEERRVRASFWRKILEEEITQKWFQDSFLGEKVFDNRGNLVGINVSKTNNDPKDLDKDDHEVAESIRSHGWIRHLDKNNQIFHAGTYEFDSKVFSKGGRVLNVTSSSEDLDEARNSSLSNLKKINWDSGFFRKDIGWRAIKKK